MPPAAETPGIEGAQMQALPPARGLQSFDGQPMEEGLLTDQNSPNDIIDQNDPNVTTDPNAGTTNP